MKAMIETHLDEHAAPLRGSDNQHQLGRISPGWLLDQDMLSSLDRAERDWRQIVMRCGDDDDVDITGGDTVAPVGNNAVAARSSSEIFGADAIDVGDHGDPATRRKRRTSSLVPNETAADDGDAHQT